MKGALASWNCYTCGLINIELTPHEHFILLSIMLALDIIRWCVKFLLYFDHILANLLSGDGVYDLNTH